MSRLSLKPAASGSYNHQYSPSTITSLDFAQIVPVRYFEVVQSDDWKKIHAGGIVRLAPQVFPPYGKLYFKTAAFFVPEHQLIEHSLALHTNMSQYKGIPVVTPHMKADAIILLLSRNKYSSVVDTQADPTDSVKIPGLDYDFIHVEDNSGVSSYVFRKLNQQGRYVFKVLKSLGYDFPTYVNSSVSATALASIDYEVNILKLLAYFKVYVDYFLNGPFYNYNELVMLLRNIHDNQPFVSDEYGVCYTATNGRLYYNGLELMFDNLLLPHESSLYTEAWNTPNSPDGSTPSLLSANPSGLISPYLSGGTTGTDTIGFSSNNNMLRNNTNSELFYLTANGLRLFKAFDYFVRRWNLSGSKAVQRVYSMFGIKSDDFKAHYAIKLFEKAERFDFYPVLSNADTSSGGSGQRLGDFAGYSQKPLEFDYNYRSDGFGYVIMVSWLNIDPLIVRGIDPENLRMNSFDWYTPQYDGQAMRAIPNIEIALNRKCNDSVVTDKSIYGFCNLYDEYRNMRSIVSGDFLNGLAKDYFFGRDFSVLREGGVIKPQLNAVHYYDDSDNADLTDPFQYDASQGDRFWIFLDFDIDSDRPVLPSSNAQMLEGVGDLSIPVLGNEMS